MRSHVTMTVSACFAVLRQLRSVRRSVPRSVLQSLVHDVTRADAAGSRKCHSRQHSSVPVEAALQSVMNSAARLMFSSSRYEHIILLLRQLHWLKAADRIDYKLALLVYKCRQGVAPPYLTESPTNSASQQTPKLDVVCVPPRHRH